MVGGAAPDDPFAGIIDDAWSAGNENAPSSGDAVSSAGVSAGGDADAPVILSERSESKDLPPRDPSKVIKKSLASSLYGLDDAKGGE